MIVTTSAYHGGKCDSFDKVLSLSRRVGYVFSSIFSPNIFNHGLVRRAFFFLFFVFCSARAAISPMCFFCSHLTTSLLLPVTLRFPQVERDPTSDRDFTQYFVTVAYIIWFLSDRTFLLYLI